MLEKVYPAEGGTHLKLSFKIAYVVETKGKEASFKKMIDAKQSKMNHCINCQTSLIRLIQPHLPAQDASNATNIRWIYSIEDRKEKSGSVSLKELSVD